MSEIEISQAEQSSVTKATVVAGLGYPADRKEVSPEPTGWINNTGTNLEKI
jgi:hypothetical protein